MVRNVPSIQSLRNGDMDAVPSPRGIDQSNTADRLNKSLLNTWPLGVPRSEAARVPTSEAHIPSDTTTEGDWTQSKQQKHAASDDYIVKMSDDEIARVLKRWDCENKYWDDGSSRPLHADKPAVASHELSSRDAAGYQQGFSSQAEASVDKSDLDFNVFLEALERDEKIKKIKKERREKRKQRKSITMATQDNAARYTEPFCKFMTENPTIFHAVAAVKSQLKQNGFTELNERDRWEVQSSGKYFTIRNGSSLIAFVVGKKYRAGNGAAIIAGHVDALTAKLKPVSEVPNKAGFIQLGIAPYAGAPNNTWWDRDLGIGGRVLVKEGDKIVTKLVKLDWPIARIPTLAPHFGAAAVGPFNAETQMTPIIGLESTSGSFEGREKEEDSLYAALNADSFIRKQPPRLARTIAEALGLKPSQLDSIVNWELELFDVQPATLGGLGKEFIFAGRIDDKMCSWAAIQALIESADVATEDSSQIKIVGLFDDEEIGSLLRQGARSNFLPQVIERAVGALADHAPASDLLGRTYANSFLLSADVIHATNPNFLNAYLENHSPQLNVGLVVSADSNGHMTTDAVSTAILKRCADRVGAKLQVFQIRNDSRSGGTVGPMLSSATGIRSIDAGIPQLSMHSIRATTGSLDPGLGVLTFRGFLDGFEAVDREFRE